MHDTDSLPLDHLEAVTDEEGVADLAALSDGLRAEREQGITIDVAYRFFSTDTRSYILADTLATSGTRATCSPAHPTPTSRSSWSTPAPACRGRPAGRQIANRWDQDFVAAVNKIDLIDFDNRFAEVEAGSVR